MNYAELREIVAKAIRDSRKSGGDSYLADADAAIRVIGEACGEVALGDATSIGGIVDITRCRCAAAIRAITSPPAEAKP